MADVDWSNCPLVEIIPDKVSGAPLLKNTRLPVDAITGNYDAFARKDYPLMTRLPKPSTATRKQERTRSGQSIAIAGSTSY